MAKNDTVNRAPLIRFPGFEDFWEEKSLGEVCDSILVGFPFKGQDITDNASGHPILRAYSIGEGIIRHGKDYDKYYPGDTKSLERYKVNTGDIVISMDGSVGRNIALISDDENGYLLIQRVARLRVTQYPVQLIYQQIISQRFKDYAAGEKVGAVIAHISQKQIESFPVFVPKTRLEQNKVASIMTETDRMISAQEQKVESLKAHKKGLMQQLFPQAGTTTPSLRFPGFTGEWQEKPFDSLCHTITPPLKLQSSQYLSSGKYPVIDQSQSLICGWTNDVNGLVNNIPSIIFGDHTCVLKFIDFPFVQGADGVKILRPIVGNDPRFVYQILLSSPVKQDGYKRHFSDLKEKTFCLPPTHDEQNKLAECLFSLDQVISAEEKELEALKVHKKGLMQQLFPQFEK